MWASLRCKYSFSNSTIKRSTYLVPSRNVAYTKLAISWAFALTAPAFFMRASRRRCLVPNQNSVCRTVTAHRRNAWPRRFAFRRRFQSTLPPLIWLLGASPSLEQKCFSVGNADTSVRNSETMSNAGSSTTPVIAVRSTPATSQSISCRFRLPACLTTGLLQLPHLWSSP